MRPVREHPRRRARGRPVKRSAVAVFGGMLTLIGIALLFLPGPGFVLVAAGLAVLATEFEWAKRPLVYAKGKADQGLVQVRENRLQAAFAFLSGLALLAVGVLGLVGVQIPFLSVLSGALLIVSGLFLLGTLFYARSQRARTRAASQSR